MKKIISHTATIPPGQSLQLTYEHHRFPVQTDASVIDRHDLEAQACLDSEGWRVIILTNVTDIPVSITPQRRNTIEAKPVAAMSDEEIIRWSG